ncbi:GyrI-like domain-containing protein [Xanthobacter sp. DSM 24535]|uniref:GyrI-like domain-containing protein n=1 Tax=Roseixanthobacter psychrophilus TaxID=3119917 RepID=UPI0037263EDB
MGGLGVVRGTRAALAAMGVAASLAALSVPLPSGAAWAQGAAPGTTPAAPDAGAPATTQALPGPSSPLSPPAGVEPRSVQTQPLTAPSAPAFTGEEAQLTTFPVLAKTGSASWDTGFETIVATLKTITAEMNRLGLKRAGDVMVVYTASDDAGFEFEAQVPFTGATTQKPQGDVKLGASFAGKVYKFTHKGSFADMDDTYESIANFLDDKNIAAQDLYIEQYRTDPQTTAPDSLVVDIFVPVR